MTRKEVGECCVDKKGLNTVIVMPKT
jgi:hypothetical protein